MKDTNREIAEFQELLARFRFTEPVPPEVKKRFIDDNRKILTGVLKSVGAFSALYGAYLAVSFALKKIAVGLTATKIVMSAAAAASVSLGGYYAAVQIVKIVSGPQGAVAAIQEDAVKSALAEKEESRPLTLEDLRKRYGRVDQLQLYNGTIIQGAVLSRTGIYRVHTVRGIMTVPSDKIKLIKPL